MSYLNIFLVGIIIGWLSYMFLSVYFSKKIKPKGESSATKEDISKITIELEELKNLYKTNKDEEEKIQEAEKEFYDSIAGDE
jgi:membrane protein insertase Oxa1/YidC/SpoIIIJ